MFSDFTNQYKDLNIDCVENSSKKIYILITQVYGNSVAFRKLEKDQNAEWRKILQNKILSEHLRDTTWSLS